jgi:hypothetical protein
MKLLIRSSLPLLLLLMSVYFSLRLSILNLMPFSWPGDLMSHIIIIIIIIIIIDNTCIKTFIFCCHSVEYRSRGSSVSIVSDYGLNDRAIGVRSPARANDFSSNLCVQTGSEAHPASCTVGTGGYFPRGKTRPGCDADHSPPSSAEVRNE